MHSRIELVPISRLVPCPWTRDETHEDLLESFTRGAKTQLQNIVCRQLPNGKLEVLAGARRVAAAKQTGWSHLEVKILDCDDRQAELVFWEENVRRKGFKGKLEARAAYRLKQLLDPAPRHGGDRRSRAFQESSGHDDHLNAVARISQLMGKSERQVRRLVAVGGGGTTTRDREEVIADRLRQALRLAARCLDELRPLDAGLRGEVRRLLEACEIRVNSTGRIQARKRVAARRGRP